MQSRRKSTETTRVCEITYLLTSYIPKISILKPNKNCAEMHCRFFTVCFALLYAGHSCNGVPVNSGLRAGSLSSRSPPKPNFIGPEKKSADSENDDDYYEDYYHEIEEPECEEGSYWHIRGLKCVPFDCPGGNQFRNKHTGDCLLRTYGINNDQRDRQLRFLNSRMKSQKNKFKLPFGLTLKG